MPWETKGIQTREKEKQRRRQTECIQWHFNLIWLKGVSLRMNAVAFNLASWKWWGNIKEKPQETFVLHSHIWLNKELLVHAGTWAQVLVMMRVWPALTSHHTHRQECDWRDGQMTKICKNMHTKKIFYISLMKNETVVAQCHKYTFICYLSTFKSL